MKINVLEPRVFNRISAGEVVENPSSVVKELVENAIDAKATDIYIEIKDGGKKQILISDNGCGIEKDDLKLAFMPHATSKIKEVDDLGNIASLGFRGEALASIASVCHVRVSTQAESCKIGYELCIDGGEFGEIQEVARCKGTTFEINDLFYNTPVREKFLRKSKTEESEVTHLIERFMLSHPEIAFSYIIDGKQIYKTPSSDLADIIYTIYGREIYENLVKVDYCEENLKLKGFIVSPKLSKPNRTYQTLFVNGRYVENYLISSCIQGIYEPFLMKGKFPIYMLNLLIPTDNVDVNIHPTKKEVKFEKPNEIFGFIRRAIDSALTGIDYIATLENYDQNVNLKNEIKESFDYIPSKEITPLSSTEGSSYRVRHDVEDLQKIELKKIVENDKKEKKIEEKEIDFSTITLNDKDKFINGPLNFTQTGHLSVKQIKKQNKEKIFKESLREEIKIIGTIFNTYVAFQFKESVYLVDQHAAHERQLFDKLVYQVNNAEIIKQFLLVPYSFKLNYAEQNIFEDRIPVLRDMGFDIYCKEDSYSISSIPLVLDGLNLKDFVDDIIKEESLYHDKKSEIIKEKLAQNACKHAIKGGDPLNIDMIIDLIDNMKKGELLCPHGRPVMVEVTKKDLEKLFKRIV